MTDNKSRKPVMIKTEDLPVPNCALLMKPEFIEHIPGESITFSFPVLEEYLNPGRTMQGGFITAAFDNVFGPLSLLEMNSFYVTTVNISTSYHRPVFAGEILKITAYVKTKGRKKLHMTADACNGEGQLVASATSDYILMEQRTE